MPAPISSPNPESIPATPDPQLVQDPGMIPPGTANQNGGDPADPQSGQASTQPDPNAPAPEETFTDVDPSKLDPQNREAYNNMLRDYKKKTTTLAEQRKQFEDAQKKAAVYDEISGDPAFVKYWNSLAQGQTPDTYQAPPPPPEPPLEQTITDEEYLDALSSKDKFLAFQKKVAMSTNKELQAKLQEYETGLKTTQSTLRASKADQFVRDFKARPEYKDFDKYDGTDFRFITYQIAAQKPSPKMSEREWDKMLKGAYSNADRAYKKIWREGYEAAQQNKNQQLSESSEPPTPSTGPVYEGGDPRGITPEQAVALGKRGIRVPDQNTGSVYTKQ